MLLGWRRQRCFDNGGEDKASKIRNENHLSKDQTLLMLIVWFYSAWWQPRSLPEERRLFPPISASSFQKEPTPALVLFAQLNDKTVTKSNGCNEGSMSIALQYTLNQKSEYTVRSISWLRSQAVTNSYNVNILNHEELKTMLPNYLRSIYLTKFVLTNSGTSACLLSTERKANIYEWFGACQMKKYIHRIVLVRIQKSSNQTDYI